SKIGDPRIIFFNIPKRGYRYPPVGINHWLAGPVTAANQALRMVKGDWIARLDDDDIWTEDHLEALLNFALQGKFEFVSGAHETINDQNEIILLGKDFPDNLLRRYLNVESEFDPNGEIVVGSPSAWLYRSYLSFMEYNIDCWRKNHNRVNDLDFIERVYLIGVKIGFLDKKVMSYFPRPNEPIGAKAFKDNTSMEEKYKFTI
ncbi:MAG: glycosyltransferase, partial [Oligoflexales bacterium]|nr:glycosyltransferase [Oligoflexales bacterium]